MGAVTAPRGLAAPRLAPYPSGGGSGQPRRSGGRAPRVEGEEKLLLPAGPPPATPPHPTPPPPGARSAAARCRSRSARGRRWRFGGSLHVVSAVPLSQPPAHITHYCIYNLSEPFPPSSSSLGPPSIGFNLSHFLTSEQL